MALTQLHVLDYCNAGGSWWNGTGKPCRYLHAEWSGSKVISMCIKKAPTLIAIKKKAVKDEWKDLGDNCPGYTYLRHAEQGYNLPKS